MARVVKAHAERRGEIIDCAQKLFGTLGYEGTSVAAIISELDISKGTFYHYFKSKEELLDSVVDRMSELGVRELTALVEDTTLSGIEKFKSLISKAAQIKAEQMDSLFEMSRFIHLPENLIYRDRMNQRSMELGVPLFARIIEQGVSEGDFAVTSPVDAAEFIYVYRVHMAEKNLKNLIEDENADPDVLIRRTEFYLETIERMLGVEIGSLGRTDKGVREAIKAAKAARLRAGRKGREA